MTENATREVSEAAMLGGKKVSNLTTIIDYNKWQATDRSQNVMALDPLTENGMPSAGMYSK